MATNTDRDDIVRADMTRIFQRLGERATGSVPPTLADRGNKVRHAPTGRNQRMVLTMSALSLLVAGAFAMRYSTAIPIKKPVQLEAKKVAQTPEALILTPRAESRVRSTAGPLGSSNHVEPVPRSSRSLPEATLSAGGTSQEMTSQLVAARRSTLQPTRASRTNDLPTQVVRTLSTQSEKARQRPRSELTLTPRAATRRVIAATRGARSARPSQKKSVFSPERCTSGSLEDRCIYQDVLSAHDRLSASYEQAKRNGMPAEYLTGVRARWARARRVATDEPDKAIERYNRLADFLDRFSQAERQ